MMLMSCAFASRMCVPSLSATGMKLIVPASDRAAFQVILWKKVLFTMKSPPSLGISSFWPSAFSNTRALLLRSSAAPCSLMSRILMNCGALSASVPMKSALSSVASALFRATLVDCRLLSG